MFDKIKSALEKEEHINNLEDKLSSDVTGIDMNYAGVDGIDVNRIVIREYDNGSTGETLLRLEYEVVDNMWYIYAPRGKELDSVSGEDNYGGLARAMEDQLSE
jgi:hypothetical protein